MAGKKLKIDDLKINQKYRFNKIEDLGVFVPEDKLLMFTHKARNIDVVAAKDTGKTFPVNLYKLYVMEKDPHASILTFMKHSTGAAKIGKRNFLSDTDAVVRGGYKFQYQYEPSTSYIYRMKDKKIREKNQNILFGSFDNPDAAAGWTPPPGGYPCLMHYDEIVLQNDTDVISDKEWKQVTKTMEDTIRRHYNSYKARWKANVYYEKKYDDKGNIVKDENGKPVMIKKAHNPREPFHEPIPFKIITTFNNWKPTHFVAKRAERFFPEKQFIDFALGFNYSKMLKLWEDKIKSSDGETPILELKEFIDDRWDEIKENIIKNHTQWKYIERDEFGIKLDLLIGRMQKFANPKNRDDEESFEETIDEMYGALITGNSLTLARAFGLGYDGAGNDENNFNFKKFIPIDTEDKLKEEGRQVMGLSVGWDHDANRGPVATPATISGKWVQRNANPFEPDYGWTDIKVMIHEQIAIEGYGKGDAGVNTRNYHESMVEISKKLLNKYAKNKDLPLGTHITFDDDDGSYVAHIGEKLMPYYGNVQILPNKNGSIIDKITGEEKNGFSVKERDTIWQLSVDTGDLLIDVKNDMLIEWLKVVPNTMTKSGDKQRSVKGQWGKRYKDISNSAEYAWYVFRYILYNGANEYFGN